MIKIFSKIKRKLKKMQLLYSVNRREFGRIYEALTSIDDIGHGEEYLAALGWALSQPNIHNIAVSGPYGSGKSSAINTYLKRYEDNEVVYISLAAFELEKMKEDDYDGNQNGEAESIKHNTRVCTEKLEAAILKQLFYSVDGEKIPQSRYRKLQSGIKTRNVIGAIALSIIVSAVVLLFFPDRVGEFKYCINKYGGKYEYIVYIVIAIAIIYILLRIIEWFRCSGNIKEIKILDKAVIGGDNSSKESIFNKNMDEIVYFFESTKKKIVIIEDLDRFENSNIFVALRELNSVINNNEKINGKVKFVYAIKDDMFTKAEERTKFFEFIIPIVPYISSMNSGEILRIKMDIDSKSGQSKRYEITEKYISLVSPYIRDMRNLISICNEFIVFKNTLKEKQGLELKDERMLSLVIYKNLYPKDFAELEDESASSLIRKAFRDKKEYISKQNTLTEKKKLEEEDELDKIEKEALNSIKELKLALVNSLLKFEMSVYSVEIENRKYYLEEILQEDFDVNLFKNKQLILYATNSNGNTNRKIVYEPEVIVKEQGDYLTRIARLKKGLVKCKEDSRHAVEEYEKKINDMKSYSLKKIIKEFGTGFLSNDVKKNDLLVFLLRNGYIDETFESYINYFHPNSITKEDMNFVLGVRNNKKVENYVYPISNPQKVYELLFDYEFKQVEVLNYDLVDYVLENDKESLELLFEKLQDQSQESMDFIKAYVDRGINLEKFFKYICNINTNFWLALSCDSAITKETQYKYLVNMLKYVEVDVIANMNYIEWEGEKTADSESIAGLLLCEEESLKKIGDAPSDKLIALIEALDIKFDDVDLKNIDINVRDAIIDDRHYALNNMMLHRIFEIKESNIIGNLETQNYTSVLQLGYGPMLDYVQDKCFFEGYIRNVVLGLDSNTQESVDSMEDIIERLSSENIELCIELIEKECAVWEDISMCLASETELTETKKILWKKLLDCNKVKPLWENYVSFYNSYGFEKELGAFFKQNSDVFLSNIKEQELTDEYIKDLLYVDLSADEFRRCIKAFGIKEYDWPIVELGEDKIKVLIEENVLPFSIERWKEMISIPEIRLYYAKTYKEAFFEAINKIELLVFEINKMIKDDSYSDNEKKVVLEKIDAEKLEFETAQILKDADYLIGRALSDAAWKLLDMKDRCILLLNQMPLYNDAELANMFGELGEDYNVFANQSRHRYKLEYTEYNRSLLEALLKRGYITSCNHDKSGENTFLVGNVKQRKSKTIAVN